jgi:hypothetical protein
MTDHKTLLLVAASFILLSLLQKRSPFIPVMVWLNRLGEGCNSVSFKIKGSSPTVLRTETYRFSGWHPIIDGEAMPFSTQGAGAIILKVLKGDHDVLRGFED